MCTQIVNLIRNEEECSNFDYEEFTDEFKNAIRDSIMNPLHHLLFVL